MERLTYDFCIAGKHCWQVKGADNLECGEVCKSRDNEGCNGCPIANAFDRLAAIEDILGDDYDLDRLKELVEADKEGRLIVSPCKIGDIVWSAHELIGLNSHQIRRIERNNEGDFVCSALMFGFEDFGKIWFLHKQEAESALERMEGEEK